MKRPLVSIIIPVYNASRFVEESVYSALNQTYSDIEVVVVNDGSTDDSLDKLLSIHDDRLRIFSQLNQGPNVARNRGLKESRGEYVKFLDADDVLYPQVVATQVEQMAELGEDEVVFGDLNFIDEKGVVYHEKKLDKALFESSSQDYWIMRYWNIATSAPLHRRSLLDKVGGWDVMLLNHQESMLHLAMSIHGVRFVYRPLVVAGYRNYQSADRITTLRISRAPKLNAELYRLSRMSELVEWKYGKGVNQLSDHICQVYFDVAFAFLRYRMYDEAKCCLSYCKRLPHSSDVPRLWDKNRNYRQLMVLTKVLGLKLAFRVVYKLNKMFKAGSSQPSQVDLLKGIH